MTWGKEVERSDKYIIKKKAFNNAVDAINMLKKINFAGRDFNVSYGSSGISVALRKNDTVDKYPFQIIGNTASISDTVDVRAGHYLRWVDGYDSVNGNLYHLTLSIDPTGVSGDYDDTKSLTGFANGYNYVYLTLDDPFEPATLTLTTDPTYLGSGLFTREKMAIGKVHVTTGVIDEIEQIWTGGQVIDFMTFETDNCSLEIDNVDKHYQLHEWSNNSTTAISVINDADRIIKVENGSGCLGYTTWSNAKADVISSIVFPPLDCADVEACVDSYVDCAYINALGCGCGYITELAHENLTDVKVGGTGCPDHHSDDFAAGNYSYIGNTGDFARNNMSTGLGTAAGVDSVGVDARILYSDVATTSVDWGNRVLKESAGNTTVDWQNNQLTNGDYWYATSNFQTTLTCLADKFQLHDALANYWNGEWFYSSTATGAILEAPSATIRAGAMTCSIECNSAGPDINFQSSGGELNIDGVECLSTTSYAVVDPSNGDLHDATWLHGFLTAVT